MPWSGQLVKTWRMKNTARWSRNQFKMDKMLLKLLPSLPTSLMMLPTWQKLLATLTWRRQSKPLPLSLALKATAFSTCLLPHVSLEPSPNSWSLKGSWPTRATTESWLKSHLELHMKRPKSCKTNWLPLLMKTKFTALTTSLVRKWFWTSPHSALGTHWLTTLGTRTTSRTSK